MILQKSKMEMFHLKCGLRFKFMFLLLILGFGLLLISVPNSAETNKKTTPLVKEFDLAINEEFQVEFYRP